MHRRLRLVMALLLFSIALLMSPLPAQAALPLFLPLAMSAPAQEGTPGGECRPDFDFIASADEASETAIFLAMNAQRALHGVLPLTLNADLTQSSRLHSLDMASKNFTNHTGSDGSDAGDRIGMTCYEWSAWGENIGWGYSGDGERMMELWMKSPPHSAAILDSDYEDVGVGYAVDPNSDWSHYWTVNFGTRK